MSERDDLQAQTAEETRQAERQSAALRERHLEELTGHAVALLLTGGFFLLAFAVLLGFVNIEQAPVATMVGTIIGLAAAKIDPILYRYFKMVPGSPQKAKPEPEADDAR